MYQPIDMECNFDRGREYAECPICGAITIGNYFREKLYVTGTHCVHFQKFITKPPCVSPFAVFQQQAITA
jgi:hypothetical protein